MLIQKPDYIENGAASTLYIVHNAHMLHIFSSYQDTVEATKVILQDTDTAVQTNGSAAVTNQVDTFANNIFGDVNGYTAWLLTQVNPFYQLSILKQNFFKDKKLLKFVGMFFQEDGTATTFCSQHKYCNDVFYIFFQIQDNIGACRPVFDAYTDVVDLLCGYAIDTLVRKPNIRITSFVYELFFYIDWVSVEFLFIMLLDQII